jgi:hypothetical protein
MNRALHDADWKTITLCLPLLHWETKMNALNDWAQEITLMRAQKVPISEYNYEYVEKLIKAFTDSLAADGLMKGKWQYHGTK